VIHLPVTTDIGTVGLLASLLVKEFVKICEYMVML